MTEQLMYFLAGIVCTIAVMYVLFILAVLGADWGM